MRMYVIYVVDWEKGPGSSMAFKENVTADSSFTKPPLLQLCNSD